MEPGSSSVLDGDGDPASVGEDLEELTQRYRMGTFMSHILCL